MTPLELVLGGALVGVIVAIVLQSSRTSGGDTYIVPDYQTERRGGCGGEIILAVVSILVVLAIIGGT